MVKKDELLSLVSEYIENESALLLSDKLNDQLLFVTEHDFCCTLEHFLHFRIGEVDPNL